MFVGGENKLLTFGMTTRISHSEVLSTAYGAAIQGNAPSRLGLLLSSGHSMCISYSTERSASTRFLCLFVHVSELTT
jgi:hypothetical protein